MPEAEEVTKPQPRKKAKASKGKNIVKELAVTIEDLDQALTKSTEVLTNKWSKFASTHLDVLTGIAQRNTELKELVERTTTSTAASSALVNA